MKTTHDLRDHLTRNAVEDATWLLDNGETWERVTQRTGITRDAYEKHLTRHPARQEAP